MRRYRGFMPGEYFRPFGDVKDLNPTISTEKPSGSLWCQGARAVDHHSIFNGGRRGTGSGLQNEAEECKYYGA
jgi:hypothetical protein